MVAVTITSQITIDDSAADILNRLSSDQLADKVAAALEHQYSRAEVLQRLNAVHCETARILKARAAAEKALRPD
jgi:hypothetical protein